MSPVTRKPAAKRAAARPHAKRVTPEKLAERESDDVTENDAPYYCPGCGRRYDYQRECKGSNELPHPAIEVVSTDELSGPPEGHTPAPPSE